MKNYIMGFILVLTWVIVKWVLDIEHQPSDLQVSILILSLLTFVLGKIKDEQVKIIKEFSKFKIIQNAIGIQLLFFIYDFMIPIDIIIGICFLSLFVLFAVIWDII